MTKRLILVAITIICFLISSSFNQVSAQQLGSEPLETVNNSGGMFDWFSNWFNGVFSSSQNSSKDVVPLQQVSPSQSADIIPLRQIGSEPLESNSQDIVPLAQVGSEPLNNSADIIPLRQVGSEPLENFEVRIIPDVQQNQVIFQPTPAPVVMLAPAPTQAPIFMVLAPTPEPQFNQTVIFLTPTPTPPSNVVVVTPTPTPITIVRQERTTLASTGGLSQSCPSGTEFGGINGSNIICVEQSQNQVQNAVANANAFTGAITVNVAGAETPRVVEKSLVLANTATLPKTGLPIIAWGITGLVPLGFRLRRFGNNLNQGTQLAQFIWQQREWNRN